MVKYLEAVDTASIVYVYVPSLPGVVMDGSVMEGDPYKMIEGMVIAAYAVDIIIIFCIFVSAAK